MFSDSAAVSLFRDHFHDGLEEIDLKPELVIQSVEQFQLFLVVITQVAYGLTDHRVVLLLYMAVVIFPIRPGPAEADSVLLAVLEQGIVDELTSII